MMVGGRIADLVIRVTGAEGLASWYTRVLGMTEGGQLDSNNWTAKFPGQSVRLVFQEAAAGSRSYEASRQSCYWKIGICVADVDLAREKIIKQGTEVSQPSQFLEVGYLCHLKDPRGFTIELLQQTFQRNFVKPEEDRSLALGQSAVVGQVTTRTTNIEASLGLYRDQLGMKLLSIQDISVYGFSLYFLAFTSETPPVPGELESVENREWLWQRDFTTLEIQHRPGGQPCSPMDSQGEGVSHLVMEVEGEAFSNITQHLREGGRYRDHDGVELEIKKVTADY